jgi:hypothetical protein
MILDKNQNRITLGRLRAEGYQGENPITPEQYFEAAKLVKIPVEPNAVKAFYVREARIAQFKAFDIYKSNVSYGVEVESPQEHDAIKGWYEEWLNLPVTISTEDPITYPETPLKISKYL